MKHITKVRELYEETIHWISKSEDSWKNFLSCMGRLYQLDFLNTCMVYAQRPDASVLAGYDAWHEMDLPVARGSKGIAVFPSKIFGEGVTHVYDIQDVKGGNPALELAGEWDKPQAAGKGAVPGNLRTGKKV